MTELKTDSATINFVDPGEAVGAAREAGLRYVSDAGPGIRRRRRGNGFGYRLEDGSAVTDEHVLARIRSLAVPPAWTDVWICPDERGHIQATGRDARGRKQYRYHPRWREVRDEDKYARLAEFGRALPRIRRRVGRDLARRGLDRDKVLAMVVRLLESTLIRVGNEEYAQHNGSYGLTTLRARHARVKAGAVRFYFRGKGGKETSVGVHSRRLARVTRQLQELPGQALFQYVGADGERHRIDSDDVNQYLRDTTGRDFTAKDFRTWAGTVLAASALRHLEPAANEARARSLVAQAVDLVASELGNTRSVCLKNYIHPAVVDAYRVGALAGAHAEPRRGLRLEEGAVLALLEQRLRRRRRRAA